MYSAKGALIIRGALLFAFFESLPAYEAVNIADTVTQSLKNSNTRFNPAVYSIGNIRRLCMPALIQYVADCNKHKYMIE